MPYLCLMILTYLCQNCKPTGPWVFTKKGNGKGRVIALMTVKVSRNKANWNFHVTERCTAGVMRFCILFCNYERTCSNDSLQNKLVFNSISVLCNFLTINMAEIFDELLLYLGSRETKIVDSIKPYSYDVHEFILLLNYMTWHGWYPIILHCHFSHTCLFTFST